MNDLADLHSDELWCINNAPSDPLDPYKVYQEAQVLSSYAHLAAFFAVEVDDLKPYKKVIERAKLVAEHSFLQKLKALADSGDRQAIALYAEHIKLTNLNDDTTPKESGVDTNKTIRDAFRHRAVS